MKIIIVAFSFALILFVSALALAQSSGDDFTMTKISIDNGGGRSAGGEFALTGTIGQPDANSQASSWWRVYGFRQVLG